VGGLMHLEVLDRRGRVVSRVRLDSFPVVVGRALTSDVILDDRYVSPQHARITCDGDGELVIEDLDSENGLHCLAPRARVRDAVVRSGMRFRVGRTLLRFRSAETRIEPTLLDQSGTFTPENIFGRRSLAWLISCLCFGFFGLQSYLGHYEKEPLQDVLFTFMAWFTAVAIWATGWALVNRIVGQQWRFSAHFALTCAFLLAFLIFATLLEYWAFLFSVGWALFVVDGLATAVLMAGLFNGHLTLLTTVASRRRAISACVTAVTLVAAVEGLAYYQQTRFSSMINVEIGVKPLPAAWVPARSVDAFLAEMNDLRLEVDLLAAKEGE